MKFGIHTGPQLCTIDQLRELWRFADASGFAWVSIWDHFYPAQFSGHDGPCLEAVATHTALACETRNVRVGCLVYCVPYRHPAVLAKALVTIDHVSGGRMECGLGAGWHQQEFAAHGIPFLPIAERLDQLEEAAQIVRSLFDAERTTFPGRHFQLQDAYCSPKPLQERAASVDRRRRREAPAADGGASRRRLEHPLRRPRRVRSQEPCPDRLVRARAARSGVHPAHREPRSGPRRARGRPAPPRASSSRRSSARRYPTCGPGCWSEPRSR